MPRLLLLLAIGGAIYIAVLRIRAMPPHRRRSAWIQLGGGIALVAIIILTLMGRMHWIGAALGGLLVAARQSLPLLIRLFPVLTSLRNRQAQAGSRQSTMRTRILAMSLDHETGRFAGEVLEGSWRGWRLDDLDREQLRELSEFCARHDPDARQLLEGYLEQRFPEGDGEASTNGGAPPTDDTLSEREAREILGVGEDADEAEIVAAHRRLMQRLHPDRGGSDYLAARINAAKARLLGA